MADKTLPLLDAGTDVSGGDLFLTSQVGQTQAKKVTGDQIRSFTNSVLPPAGGLRVALIGTSLVQQNAVGTSNRTSTWSRGWMSWLSAYTKGAAYSPIWSDQTVVPGWEPSGTPGATRGFQGLNFGVSGQTVPQIIARLPYIEQNYKDAFDIIIVDAGTNDVASGNAAGIQGGREQICDFFLNLGKIVILLPILARSTSAWAPGSVARKTANFINNKTRAYVKTRKNLYFYDWDKQWVDGSTADGAPFAGSSNDGTHFNVKGGDDVGYDFAQFLLTIIPPANPRVWSNDDVYDPAYNPSGNGLANAMCLGTSGQNGTASSGTVATGMRSERNTGSLCSVVASKEPRADNRGEWQVLSFDVQGANEELFLFRTVPADISHDLAGKWVTASVEVVTNDTDALTGVTLFVRDNGVSGTFTSEGMAPFLDGSSNAKLPPKYRSYLIETPPLRLAADSTSLRWRVEIRVQGPATTPPVVKLGGIEWRVIPDPRPSTLV